MELFPTIIRQIVQEEGPGIFLESFLFWAIAEDYAGGRLPEELEMVRCASERNLLSILGDAYLTTDNGERQRLVRTVERRMQEDGQIPEESVISFCESFCNAFHWDIELSSAQRQREARERAEAERRAEAARRAAERQAIMEQQALEQQLERERLERERRNQQLKRILKWAVPACAILLILAIGIHRTGWPHPVHPGDTQETGYSDSAVSGAAKDAALQDAYGSDADEIHTYAIFDIKEEGLDSFQDCERFCEQQGGHLAVINSQEENDYLYQMVLDAGLNLAFFGFSDELDEGSWSWSYGVSDYTNWSDGQPNNGKLNSQPGAENYAEFHKAAADGSWNDAPFGKNTYHFICEWETNEQAGNLPEDGAYILPYSDQMYLNRSDLQGLSKEELRLARNELYARKGRIFQDPDLRSYFLSKDWYRGSITAEDFDEKEEFNDFEYYNAYFIRDYEMEQGYLEAQ